MLLVPLSTMMYIGCERSTCELMVPASCESFLLNLLFSFEIFFFFFFFFFGDFSLDFGRLDSRDFGRMLSLDFGREDSLEVGRDDSLDGGLPLD